MVLMLKKMCNSKRFAANIFSFLSAKSRSLLLVYFLLLPNYIFVSRIITGGHFFSVVPSDIGDLSLFYQRIELDKTWEITKGSSSTMIGLIDSGINGNDVDLIENVNSTLSLDLFDPSRSPLIDGAFHGTGVAKYATAQGNNNYGTSGVCWYSDLISLRIDNNTNHLENPVAAINAIEYASSYDPNDSSKFIPILNFSGGFYSSYRNEITQSQINSLQSAINYYPGLLICAAGNGNENLNNPVQFNIDQNNGLYSLYPQCLTNDNILVVGGTVRSTDSDFELTNYGYQSVDLFAPSDAGTSHAAPLVSGTAALMLTVNPTLSASQIKTKIMENVDEIDFLNGKCVTGGRLNVYKSVLSAIPSYTQFDSPISSIVEIPSGGTQWIQLTMPSGNFRYESTGSLDLTGTLYEDVQENYLTTSSSGGSGNNFSFTYSSPTSKHFYLRIDNNSNASGSYGIIITSIHAHSYGAMYLWKNYNIHRSKCFCGAYINEGHAVENGTNICIRCHGPTNGGFIGPDFSNLDDDRIVSNLGQDSYILDDGLIVLGPIDLSIVRINSDYYDELAEEEFTYEM